MKSIEESLTEIQAQIDNYKPATKWEEANGRTLKSLIERRNRLEKALERNHERQQEDSPRTEERD